MTKYIYKHINLDIVFEFFIIIHQTKTNNESFKYRTFKLIYLKKIDNI